MNNGFLNNDYYPYGMLVPNRNYQSPEYRYGFQGQEKDDEVKGSGNSVNYKYRMHDPRLGRFFATDPLMHKYPFYSPYHFSSNQPIHTFELEGLESYRDLGNNLDPVIQRIRVEQGDEAAEKAIEDFNYGMKIGAGIGGYILLESLVTKGQITKFLAKQYAAQLGTNLTVEGITYLISEDAKFDTVGVFEDTFAGFDFADAGFDATADLILDKYKLGKIEKVIKTIAPSLFDITIKDGVQTIGWNKEASAIITDIVGNILMEGLETKLSDSNIELPTIKLSAAKEADILTTYLMKQVESFFTIKSLDVSTKKKKKNVNDVINEELKKTERKKDNIPNN